MKLLVWIVSGAALLFVAPVGAATAITANTDCVAWVKAQYPSGSLRKGQRESYLAQCQDERKKLSGKKK